MDEGRRDRRRTRGEIRKEGTWNDSDDDGQQLARRNATRGENEGREDRGRREHRELWTRWQYIRT